MGDMIISVGCSGAGQAAQELAAELDVYATAPAMAAAVKSKRRAAPAYAGGAGGGGAGEEDDDDDDAYQVMRAPEWALGCLVTTCNPHHPPRA